MHAGEIAACLTVFGAAPSDVKAIVVYRTPGQRLVRALGGLGLFWGLAVVGIFIPVAHFILVPTLFTTGIIVAGLRAREDRTLAGVRGACPRCGVAQEFRVGGRFTRERNLDCPNCHNQLLLTVNERPDGSVTTA